MTTGNSPTTTLLQTRGEEVQRKRPSNQTPVLIHGRGEKQAAHRIVEKVLEC